MRLIEILQLTLLLGATYLGRHLFAWFRGLGAYGSFVVRFFNKAHGTHLRSALRNDCIAHSIDSIHNSSLSATIGK